MNTAGFYITFNTNGGSAVTSQYAAADSLITAPTVPVKTGFTFAGWYIDAGLATPWVFASSTITAATTLYAKWTVKSFSIIFNGNGATGGSMTNQAVDFNATITLQTNNYTNSGLYFAGWNTVSDGSGTSYGDGVSYTLNTTGDITLYAQWVNFSTATFSNAGASGQAGPTQAQLTAAYAGTALEGDVTNPTANDGYQLWTIPVTGIYTIEARGAQGAANGSASYTGANGAVMIGDFSLIAGDQLIILVGQQGSQSAIGTDSSAGGGGTFVTIVDSGSSYTLTTSSHKVSPLIIAGGGGGVGGNGSQPGVSGTTWYQWDTG